MRVLSLFSGIGAFEKALTNMGVKYELVNYCEIDKYASKSYSAIHGVPESKNLGDITKVYTSKLPHIDIISYGFPCQDISRAGYERGLFNEDGSKTRSGLFFEALRIIEDTKPAVAIAENVKNLTSKKFSEQFQIVLESLDAAGYNNYWQVLNAKDYGIPQNRERVFIVSIRKDLDTGAFKFPDKHDSTLKLTDLLENLPYHSKGRVYKEFGSFYTTPRGSDGKLINGSYNRIWKNEKYVGTLNLTKIAEIGYVDNEGLHGRKLSALESWRVMGFDDEDFYKAKTVNDDSKLIKQAGNSIVVDVLVYLFKQVLEVVEMKKVEDKVTVLEGDDLINLVALKEKEPELYEELLNDYPCESGTYIFKHEKILP